MKAQPDDFVLLVACEFSPENLPYICATHEEFWQEQLDISLDGPGGVIALPEVEVRLHVDQPIPELHEFASRALEPFGASDLAMLTRHTAIWRLTASGPFAAWPLVRLTSTFIESGACAAFLPATHQLHSPRAVQRFAMDPTADAIANFYVSAFDGEGWMRTRGLTPFRLPEVETRIHDGHNAAYFRLMDVAAAMVANGRAFSDGATLSIGPQVYTLITGPNGPLRDEYAMNGMHGVQTLS